MAESYDVFISFKNLDAKGQPTRDSVLAHAIFHHLKSKGLSVFFSNVALEQAGVAAFKAAIDDALDRSETLVAVGTCKENLESQWVRYEWDSFCNDMLSGSSPNSRMFTYVEGLDPRSLPRALRQSQMIEHGEGSLDRLYRFISNGLGDQKKNTERSAIGKISLMKSHLDIADKTLSELKRYRDPVSSADSTSEPDPHWQGLVIGSVLGSTQNHQEEMLITLLSEVTELDRRTGGIMKRVNVLELAQDPATALERDSLWREVERLRQERNSKMDAALKLMDKRNLADIFK